MFTRISSVLEQFFCHSASPCLRENFLSVLDERTHDLVPILSNPVWRFDKIRQTPHADWPILV